MKKAILTSTLLIALAIGWSQPGFTKSRFAKSGFAKKFDLEETIEKAKKSLKKETQKVKETINKTLDEAKDVVEKELARPKKSWFSLGRLTSLFSLESILLSRLPLVYILLLAFLIGIVTSFTPCIYPMIPITMGILQSQASTSLWRNFLLSTTYVTGIATVYATLGYFAATTTLILGQWLANPIFIGFLVLLFLYLAFSMFGFYEIYMPGFMQQRGTGIKVKGSFFYTFLFGAISGTAASPCLTPALALLLGFVAKRGNPLIGFATLFSFAFGMGLLLIVVGTFSTSLTALPRAGAWMDEIKKFFGFLLIGVSVYFVQPFIEPTVATILYALLAIIMFGYYGMVIGRAVLRK